MVEMTEVQKRHKRTARSERFHKNRQIRILARQEQMHSDRYVSRLETIDLELHEISESCKRGILIDENGDLVLTREDLENCAAPQLLPALSENDERTIRLRIQALKESAVINFKLLNKTLPDARTDAKGNSKDERMNAFAKAISRADQQLDDVG